MNLLFIGGTRFVGRAMVATALAQGHSVTLFHRGQTNPDLFPECEHLLGDRQVDLSPLAGRRWDAVIDVNGYVPRYVRMAAEFLRDAVDRYVFVSTISVYDDGLTSGADESAPLRTLEDETIETVTGETYGGLKVLCERAVDEVFPGRSLHYRPGLVVGPHDPTDRFTYYVARAAQGGTLFAAGDPDRRTQIIDARDLGAFCIRQVEAGATGAVHVVGPEHPLTWGALIDACRRVAGVDLDVVWGDDDFCAQHDVSLPLYVPAFYNAIMELDHSRAIAAGLTFHPLEDTIRATLDWWRTERAGTTLSTAPAAEQEAEWIAARRG